MGKPFMRIQEASGNAAKPETDVVKRQIRVEDDKEVNIPDSMRKIVDEYKVAIKVPKYTTVEHGNIHVSYAKIKDDYYYQIELIRKSPLNEKDVLAYIIHECSTIIPNHVDVYVHQPPKDIDWDVYTVIAKGAAKLLGAKEFMEDRLVNQLLELPLWPKSTLLKRVR